MKKGFLIALLLLPFLGISQFVLTPDGFRTEGGQDFYVKEIADKSKDDLFMSTYKSVKAMYNNPSDEIIRDSTEIVSVTSIAKKAVAINVGIKLNYDLTYKLSFEFKDGKIKVNAPAIIKIADKDGDLIYLNRDVKKEEGGKMFKGRSVYAGDNLRMANVKNDLEYIINEKVNAILKKTQDDATGW